MTRKSELIALAAALSIVAPTAAAAGSRSSESLQTIKFAVAFHDVQLDLGKPGPSIGDERTFADSLVDAKGKKVGHDAGVCTFTTLTPPEAGCSITFFLSGGEIATQFLNAPPPRKVTAIVGGTGIYRGASGEAVIVEGPKQTGTIIFRLTR